MRCIRFALIFALLLLLVGCTDTESTKRLSESLSGDYSCRMNVQSLTGELLFGGTLTKECGGYTYTLDYPTQTRNAKYIFDGEDFSLKIGDMVISVAEGDLKLGELLLILEGAAEGSLSHSERVSLYGEPCMKIDLAGGELYFANNKPLLLVTEQTRAEITGFTYGKDDNFGNKDQESVA